MDDYMLFTKGKQGRRAVRVPCMLGSVLIVYYCSDVMIELNVYGKESGKKSFINHQGEEVSEVFCEQLADAS